MRYLSWDETLFKDETVFDPDYLPDVLLHRETQLAALAANLRPALRNSTPIHSLLFGPPATGKTSAIRIILNEIDDYAYTAYIRCNLARTAYRVMARIFESVCRQQPPRSGASVTQLYDSICQKLADEGRALIVALDDFNFLDADAANDILYTLLKAHDEYAVKIGIVAATAERIMLDAVTGSIFHPDEIYFPLYDEDEIRSILEQRVRLGYYEGAVTDEALDKVVELTVKTSDLRFGIYLLRMAGIEAERRASRKVEVEDVERVYEGGARVFLAKSISALNSDERETLKIIYSIKEKEVNSGDVYRILRDEVGMSYTRFYEIINKLERLRLIDAVVGKKGRGRTRYIVRKYDADVVTDALEW